MTDIIESGLLKKAFDAYNGPAFNVKLDYSGRVLNFGAGNPLFTIHFVSRSAFTDLIVKGDLGFVDAYMDERITVDGDLVAALGLGSNPTFAMPGYWWVNNLIGRVYTILNPDDKNNARKNIQRHYDLGNDFYSMWLDRNMQYTCAFFDTPKQSLDAAQENKMAYICRKLGLRPGMTMLEMGSGWGGFAIYAAKKFGVKVTALNISREQTLYARESAAKAGADVDFLEADYREAKGVYDRVAVIGMAEHVGEGNYNELAGVVNEHLRDNGLALWHFISRVHPRPTDPFSAKYIFPGGHIPALSEVIPHIENNDLMVLDIDNLRLHYAKTLLYWRAKYLKHIDEVVKMYDPRFFRMWDLYLAGSASSFIYGEMTLAQVLMAKGRPKDLPINRDHFLHPEKEILRWKDWTLQ